MQHLKVVVIKDLVILILDHHFQTFLKIFLAMIYLEEEEDGRRSSNRGNDLRYDVSISLEEAYSGLNKKVNYTTYKKCLDVWARIRAWIKTNHM